MRGRTWIYVVAFSTALIGLKYLAIAIGGFESIYLFLAALLFGFLLLGFFFFCLNRLLFRKEMRFLYPMLVSVLALYIAIFEPVEYVIEKMKSDPVFAGHCEHTVTNVRILMRADSTFEYDAGAFLKREIYYGRYEKRNDTIFLRFKDSVPENTNTTLKFRKSYDDIEYLGEIGDTTKHRHGFKPTLNNLK